MRKKNPVVAAVLSFIFGPVGFLYIGWRYALLSLPILIIFVFVLTVANFPIPEFMKYVILVVFAWKGFTIATVRNAMIDAQDEDVSSLNTFPVAAMAMTDLLVGIAMFYAGTIGLYVSARLILEGNIFRGLLCFLLGTPTLVMISSLVFGLIATGIDAIFITTMKSPFRR